MTGKKNPVYSNVKKKKYNIKHEEKKRKKKKNYSMEHSNVMQMKPSTSYTIVTICTGYRFHKAANVKEEEEKKRREEDMHGIVYIGDNESRSFARVRERERDSPKISRNLLQRI